MRTTIRLEDALLRQAKASAADQGKSLTALIEEALRLLLAHGPVDRSTKRPAVALRASKSRGGTLPGIDLDDSRALYDLMDAAPPVPARVAETAARPAKKPAAKRKTTVLPRRSRRSRGKR